MAWYPPRSKYYTPIAEDAEIEQGDIFWGVPILRATHPSVVDRFLPPGDLPTPEDLDPPFRSEVLRGIEILADAVMIMPHTCDFHGPEKGRTHRDRLVARIQLARTSGIVDLGLLTSGEGYQHTFFLPSWDAPNDNRGDLFVNLRQMSTVDGSYLSRRRRLARLSPVAVICLRRRLTQFFTDYAPTPSELVRADERGGLLRGERDLIPVEDLRKALGEENFGSLIRKLYDPRFRSGES